MLALAVIVSVEIGSVVVWRAFNHEMTGYDFVWLLAGAGVGTACASRLFHPRTLRVPGLVRQLPLSATDTQPAPGSWRRTTRVGTPAMTE